MTVMILAILGAIVGLSVSGGSDLAFGAAVGGALGAVAGWVQSMQRRLRALERATWDAGAPSASRAAEPPGERSAPLPSREAVRPAPSREAVRAAPGADAPGERVREREPVRERTPRGPARAQREREPSDPALLERAAAVLNGWFTTGNVPVKIGVLLSVFGIGFLVKEAADRDWLVVPLPLRLLAIAAFGVALLAVGWRLRDSRRIYALSMQGGGVAIVYVTIYASFALYGLLPPASAFALLIAAAAAGAAAAVLQDSRALAVLSIVGGFLAPVLASTGAGDHVLLFSYYAVLNTAVFGIAWFKSWRALNVLGFAFTFVVASLWGVLEYAPERFASTEPFLVLFVVMYALIPVLFAQRQPPRLKGVVDGTLVFGTPLVGFGLQARLVGDTEYGLAFSAIALAAGYAALAAALARRGGDERRVLIEAYAGLAVAFTAIAVPLALDARWTSVAWSVQGAAMIWLGLRQHRSLPLLAGIVLQLLAAAAYGVEAVLGGAGAGAPAVLNGDYLGAAVIAGAGWFSSWAFDRLHGAQARARDLAGARLSFVWGTAWWIGAGLAEIDRVVPLGYGTSATLLFAAGSVLLAMLAAWRLSWPRIGAIGWLLLPAMVLAFAATSLPLAEAIDRGLHPFGWPLAWLAWPAALAMHFAFLYRFAHRYAGLGQAGHAGAYWLLAALAAFELHWLVGRWVGGVWPAAAALAGVAGAVLATLAALRRPLPVWPLTDGARTYLVPGCGGVVAALIVATLALNVSSPGDAAPLPYVPLLNPLELASIAVALAAVRWHGAVRSEREPVPADRWPEVLMPVLAVGLLLTMAVARAVHHWTGVAFELEPLAASNVMQAALSIVWGAAALAGMLAGARSRRRAVWLGGAALMAVVVVKLFFVELGDTGTLTRIVSFLGVGVLLMIVGYLAPAPPPRAREPLPQ